MILLLHYKKLKTQSKKDVKKEMQKSIANSIEYVFEANAVKKAFESCINVLKLEINMNQLVEFNNICTISDKKFEEIDEGDWEGKNLIETNNLQESIEYFVDYFNIDVRSLFLSDNTIEERLQKIISSIKEGDRKVNDFSIKLDKNSNLDTLFNVLYARQIQLVKHSIDEQVVEYSDFEYQDFFDAIDEIILKNKEIKSFEFDHTGGDVNSNEEYLDLYYKFELN